MARLTFPMCNWPFWPSFPTLPPVVQCLGAQEPEQQYASDTASRISDLLARKAAEAHAKKHRTPPVRLADSAWPSPKPALAAVCGLLGTGPSVVG